MNLYKNVSVGSLGFGRFKLKVGETVPAVPYTANEDAAIAAFIQKGLLSVVDSTDVIVTEVEAVAPVVEEAKVEQGAPVVEDTTDTTEDTTDTPKKNGRGKRI